MAFNQLSEVVQNIYIVEFEYKAKLIMLGVLLLYAIWYLGIGHKKWETPYIIVGLLKLFLFVTSACFLVFAPLFSWLLSPNVSIDYVILFIMTFYTVGLILLTIVFMINFFYFTPAYLLKLTGIKTGIKRDNIILSKMDDYIVKKMKMETPR